MIDIKKFDNAFRRGYKSFFTGDSNPYPQHSMNAKEFQRGYNAAYAKNKSIISRNNYKAG